MNANNGAKDEQTYAVIGAAMPVHGELGHGFLEAVYCEALQREFENASIPYQKEVRLPISYRGRPLTVSYRADFICFSSILIEIKALQNLTGNEGAPSASSADPESPETEKPDPEELGGANI